MCMWVLVDTGNGGDRVNCSAAVSGPEPPSPIT